LYLPESHHGALAGGPSRRGRPSWA
jgi:hypothetical protein